MDDVSLLKCKRRLRIFSKVLLFLGVTWTNLFSSGKYFIEKKKPTACECVYDESYM